jgi:hypothetical protein
MLTKRGRGMKRLPVLAVFAAMAFAAAMPQGPLRASAPEEGLTSAGAQVRVAVRTGDVAPVTAHVPWQVHRPGYSVDGGVVFSDGRTAVFKHAAGETTVLAYVGERYPGGTIAWIGDAVPAPDGSVIARASSAAGGYALLRLPAGGGAPEVLLASGQEVMVSGGTAIVSYLLSSPAVDGAGAVVITAWIGPYPGMALIRVPPSGAPEVLLRDGDPLGGAAVRRFLSSPAVNASGTIAFAAELTSDVQVMATLAPGMAAVVAHEVPLDATFPIGPLQDAAPTINGTGDLAFLWFVPPPQPTVGGFQIRVQRIRGGVSTTIAEAGSPGPGGDTFQYVFGPASVIDSEGRVLFGAARTYPVSGIYRFDDAAEVIAEYGGDAGNGATFTWQDAEPGLGSDGTIVFASHDTMGYALFSRAGDEIHEVVRADDPVTGPARFATFALAAAGAVFGPVHFPPPPIVSGPLPHLGVGPFLSPGGRMIFDASVTGGQRGLFVREPDGALAAVAMGGDAAPGGGRCDGFHFSHHSVNDAGTVVFLARAIEGAPSYNSTVFLAFGPAAGPLTRIVSANDPVPDSSAPVEGFPPPSKVNATGLVAVPLYLSDHTVVLYGWDGSLLVRVAGPGDLVPGEGAILSILFGQPPRLHPPLLDDAGDVVFEAVTALGGHALYRAPLRGGGAAEAVRLVGIGDSVEDGSLSSFSPQAYDRDASGRLAFQNPAPGAADAPIEAVTYVAAAGAQGQRVAGPGDVLPDIGSVGAVIPHLALVANQGLVHEVAGPDVFAFASNWLLLSARPPASLAAQAGFGTTILAGPGLPSPDGGTYLPWSYLYPDPPAPPQAPLQPQPGPDTDAALVVASTVPRRLATNGESLVAWMTPTTAGPETIVLFDLALNDAPIPAAGPDQVVECAGPTGTAVTLDASGSMDPNGDSLTYAWSGPFGTATGRHPVVSLPLGTSTITLTVRDTQGAASSAAVHITVQDTLPPAPIATADPAVIWPPDGRLRPVHVSIATQDICDPSPAVTLVGITVSDRRGAGLATDVVGAATGTDDRDFEVRARRTGGREGRTYTALYTVTDGSGHSVPASASVRVAGIGRR